MFEDCVSLIYAPELPATILAEGCYANMFCGCNSLTETPVLPAEILTDGCYNRMFCYCFELNDVVCYATTNITVGSDEKNNYGSVTEWLRGCEKVCHFYTPVPGIWGEIAKKDPTFTVPQSSIVISYKVTLEPNGGTVEPAYLTTDDRGKLNSKLPIPEHNKLIFNGWYTETGDEVDQSYTFKRNTKITADWIEAPTPEPEPKPETEKNNQNIMFIAGTVAVVLALFALAFVIVKMKR